jgi:hypothetical protein
MSLKNIQDLLLEISINPSIKNYLDTAPNNIQNQFNLTSKEINNAKKLNWDEISSFQIEVAGKRLNTTVLNKINRTRKITPVEDRRLAIRNFIKTHRMARNEWDAMLDYYFDELLKVILIKEKTLLNEVIVEVIKFEKWMYNIPKNKKQNQNVYINGRRYKKTEHSSITQTPFSAQVICNKDAEISEYKNGFGETSYILGLFQSENVLLFEVDYLLYEVFSLENDQSCSLDEDLVKQLVQLGIIEKGETVKC